MRHGKAYTRERNGCVQRRNLIVDARDGRSYGNSTSDELLYAVLLSDGPWFAEQSIIHAGQVAEPLAHFAAQQRHALDSTGVAELASIDKAEWHPLDERQEFPL